MFVVIWLLTAEAGYTAFAFVIGAIVSIACGAIGMIIATRANYKTTYCAKEDSLVLSELLTDPAVLWALHLSH